MVVTRGRAGADRRRRDAHAAGRRLGGDQPRGRALGAQRRRSASSSRRSRPCRSTTSRIGGATSCSARTAGRVTSSAECPRDDLGQDSADSRKVEAGTAVESALPAIERGDRRALDRRQAVRHPRDRGVGAEDHRRADERARRVERRLARPHPGGRARLPPSTGARPASRVAENGRGLSDHGRLERHRRGDREARSGGGLPGRPRRPLDREARVARRRGRRAGGHVRRHRVDRPGGDGRADARRVRPDRRRVRERRLRRQARSSRRHAGALAGDGPDERLRRRADDPRLLDALSRRRAT